MAMVSTRALIEEVAATTRLPPEQVRRVVAATLAALQEGLTHGEPPGPAAAPAAPDRASIDPKPADAAALPAALLGWPARRLARLEQQVRAAAPLTAAPEAADDETLDDLEIRNLLRVLADWRALEERALPAATLQRQLGVSRQRLQQLRAEGKLIGLRIPLRRELFYPVWQFAAGGAPLAAISRLLDAARPARLDLPALDALMTSAAAGDGVTPAELLRRGETDRVLGIVGAAGDQGA